MKVYHHIYITSRILFKTNKIGPRGQGQRQTLSVAQWQRVGAKGLAVFPIDMSVFTEMLIIVNYTYFVHICHSS